MRQAGRTPRVSAHVCAKMPLSLRRKLHFSTLPIQLDVSIYQPLSMEGNLPVAQIGCAGLLWNPTVLSCKYSSFTGRGAICFCRSYLQKCTHAIAWINGKGEGVS